jgi:hypothetical protein
MQKLKELHKLGNIKIIDFDRCTKLNCRICELNKAVRKAFSKMRSVVAENFGDVIHTDVGVYEKLSLGGNYYFLTFIDEKTRLAWVYFLKTKDEVFEKFLSFRKMFKTQFGQNFKKLNCDGGGEFLMTKKFNEFLLKKGILSSVTPPNSPQLNGIAERFNRTLQEGVRCCLREANLPDRFWAEALAYVVFLRNRIPRKNQKESPFEQVFRRKPALKYVQQFGSRVKYVDTYYKKKLQPRAREAIFLGYTNDDFIYKVWDVEKLAMFRTRDISFDSETLTKPDIFSESKVLQKSEDIVEEKEKGTPVINEEVLENFDFPRNPNFGGGRVIETKKEKIVEIDEFDDADIRERAREDVVQEKEKEKEMNDVPEHVHVEERNEEPRILRRSSRKILDRDDPNFYSKNRSDWKKADDALSSRPKLQEKIDPDALMVHCHSLVDKTEPKNFREAMKREDSDEWLKAMKVENENLKNNETWEEVKPWRIPKDALVVDSGWVFKKKVDNEGNILHKARLVARGYTQVPGVHFEETSSPVARYETVRLLISFAAMKGLVVDQVDVVSAFLNGDLAEEIFLKLPKGINTENSGVVKLKKSLYGLKQSGRNWYNKFSKTFLQMGFKQTAVDPCLFVKEEENDLLIVLIYVDDGLIVGPREKVDKIKQILFNKFKMKDLGEAKKFLSLEIENKENCVTVCQQLFLEKVVEKFGMKDSKIRRTPLNAGTKDLPAKMKEDLFENVNLYQQAVGSLLYLSNGSRPDIAFAVGLLSRKLIEPTKNDWANVKAVISYLNHTKEMKLVYNRKFEKLEGFCDASFADCLDSKSTSGYIFKFCGGAVSWKSTKQKIVAASTMEAELVSCFDAMKEALWLQKFFDVLKLESHPIPLLCDNQSAVFWTKNNNHSDRTKHMNVRYNRLIEEIEKKNVKIEFVEGSSQVADIMTKALGKCLHSKFVERLGLWNSKRNGNTAFETKSELWGSVGNAQSHTKERNEVNQQDNLTDNLSLF